MSGLGFRVVQLWKDVLLFWISFLRLNRRGLRIEPWGTPHQFCSFRYEDTEGGNYWLGSRKETPSIACPFKTEPDSLESGTKFNQTFQKMWRNQTVLLILISLFSVFLQVSIKTNALIACVQDVGPWFREGSDRHIKQSELYRTEQTERPAVGYNDTR